MYVKCYEKILSSFQEREQNTQYGSQDTAKWSPDIVLLAITFFSLLTIKVFSRISVQIS